MQFHLNGFRAGDPDVLEPSEERSMSLDHTSLPPDIDVLIIGCGPAGLTLATQLAAFPDICTRIVEQKPGPLLRGQADGIACRTMEMFEAFGFRERVEREAYWVNETTFWKPDQSRGETIMRHGRVQDVEDGLSPYPHVILNQARIHDFYLETMRNSASRLQPDYSRRLLELRIDEADGAGPAPSHPVSLTLERVDPDHHGEIETVKARYVVGCDGARSRVRQCLGQMLHGDSANQAWGVMDLLAVTDFPDIRFKSLIQSAAEGNILLIPRERGYLVRIYVELDKLKKDERVASKTITVDHLIAAAQRILKPYTLDVKEVAWWSVYEIGQRLCDRFDDVPQEAATRLPRVFIAGDACHTHSPKAGQGMNVSMQDSFNLGWKLASVLRGQCKPELLRTYSSERQAVAKELIDFDREWASMLSAPLKSGTDPQSKGVEPAEVQKYFVRHGRYTAGTATHYKPSVITGEAVYQNLAKGFVVGERFHSAPVIRLADAKPVNLGETMRADGRWRVIAFAGKDDPSSASSPIRALCDHLEGSPTSPVKRCTPSEANIDSVIDVRAVFQQGHRELRIEAMPAFLLPAKGRYGLRDYEKMFCPDLKTGHDVFDMRGVDRVRGAMIIVRSDQYVAHVLPLDAFAELSAFFAGFMLQLH